MTEATAASRRRASRNVGAGAAVLIALVYIAAAIRFHAPADTGMFSDEWTYVMLAESLAHDGDLAYRPEDIRRILTIAPAGPDGLFLKPGKDVRGIHLTGRPPFVAMGEPDPDPKTFYFGKAFIYPLVAAPFVWMFGLNGFFWCNALVIAVAFWASYVFVGARSKTLVALLLAGAFIFATVVPAYAAWMMPELFNFTLGVLAYFCWLYKYVSPSASSPRTRWLREPVSDAVAAAILGVATFSKVTDILLLVPIVLWFLRRRDWRHAIAGSFVCVVVALALFTVNVAATGDWNYQGGPRRTFYSKFPFQRPGIGFEAGQDMERSGGLFEVMLDRQLFWPNLRANVVYFVAGRYGGLVPYFFPTVLGTLAFLLARRRREIWQWFVFGGLLLHIGLFIVTQPYTWMGSGGSIGDRYFMGAYGMSLFLFPPFDSVIVPLMAWAVGLTFVGKIILHPFLYGLRPFEPAKSGPLRILPIELTNLNGLPVMNEADRVRVWYGDTGEGDRGFQIYHFDDNAYRPEEGHKSFWIRGKSRAEMIFKTDADVMFRTTRLTLSAGPVETTATVTVNGTTQTVALAPGQSIDVRLPLGPPFIYGRYKFDQPDDAEKKDPAANVNYIWPVSIASSNGFTPEPPPDGTPADTRYLGVLVKPTIWP